MTHSRKTFRPEFEALEERKLMAGDITLAGGILTITGTDAYSDRATVAIDYGEGEVVVTMDNFNDAGQYVGTEQEEYDVANVNQIIFNGRAKNDVFRNLTGIRCTAFGGLGNDELHGGGGLNVLHGDQNDDRIYGGAGVNYLYGETGNDTLIGGALSDTLWGGFGDDTLYGGGGNDYLYGQDGVDALYGENGHDYLDGGQDGYVDQLFGGLGVDTFRQYRSAFKGVFTPFLFKLPEDSVRDFSANEGDLISWAS